MTKFGVVTQVGRSIFPGDQPRPHPKGAGPSVPQFLGPYLRQNVLTCSDEIS